MLGRNRVLAVVPARGGSRGLPRKNVRPLLGIPLIAHVARVIDELPWIDRAVASTDDDEIASVARSVGLAVPFIRPAALAAELVGDVPVLVHALTEVERIDGLEYDVVLMLQPTSPLRRPAHVEAAARVLIDEGWDAVWTVSLTSPRDHPLKQLVRSERGGLTYWDARGSSVVARQQLPPVYHRNGAAYALTRRCLLDQGVLLGVRSGAVIVDEPMVSIDDLDDFVRAEELLRARRDGVTSPA